MVNLNNSFAVWEHSLNAALTYLLSLIQIVNILILWSAVTVTCRSGSVLLSASILFGNPWDRQSTAAKKGFPLPSGLVNLGREV